MMTSEKVVWVERKPTVCLGKPVVKGTRIPIGALLGALADGVTVKEVADAYQIPVDAIYGALEYAAEQVKKALMALTGEFPEDADLSQQEIRRILRLLARVWL